ncbi:AraC family transcriptional regulator [Sutcliffiella rhizosphaerae]|uniref:HTH-type transcriptional activator RhaR n=1 Tax=Sutcliffiella rhizosphaerae TaxID=2880967 RepID=A0ABN8A918_9BACI|nr:helix-turn-helix domain-containing protein [Sutcliffiella rhizosphaerae]CAG9621628.1 HTH-type transcriptional activator RhaR [Sutcliffiella rhizosphaerae]
MTIIHGVFYDIAPHWCVENAKGQDTLVFVTEGKVHYHVENDNFELTKGDLLFIPSRFNRKWINDEKELHKKYAVVFEKENNSFVDEDLFYLKPRKSGYFEQRLAFLNEQWLGERIYFQELSQNILSELLIMIAQEKSEWRTSPIKESSVRKMQDYLLANYRRNISIEELAELTGVTPNYVTVLFKEVFGSTPIQYLHQIRINTASNLIRTTNMSVRDVAEYLGYCDQSYFNRMFKKWMGVPPSHLKIKR